MGGISSVYIKPQNPPVGTSYLQSAEMEQEILETDSHVVKLDVKKVVDNGVELRLRIPQENGLMAAETDLGRTIQYLAVENARLALENQRLQGEPIITYNLLFYDADRVVQPEIFGETLEEKVVRLEKTLAAERAQKWEAIEKCERFRVDHVNSQNELRKVQVEGEKAQDKRSVSNNSGDMETFRAHLKEKRDERQRWIAAKSREMQTLREQLDEEKRAREKLEREITLMSRLLNNDEQRERFSVLSENDQLRQQVETLQESLSSLSTLSSDNIRLKNDLKNSEDKTKNLQTTILQLNNDLKEAKRKHERSERDRLEVVRQRERDLEKRQEIEEQLKKIWLDYDQEKGEVRKKTAALKQVIEISQQMLAVRENQVKDLKEKLKEIETILEEKKKLEENCLKIEYEKQLENIKALKILYEERMQLMETERTKLKEEIADNERKMENQKEELSDLTMKYEMLAEELDDEKQAKGKLQSEFESVTNHSKFLENEVTVMNTMFTQMLLGPYNTGSETDLDRLTALLQENHDLIADMTSREECNEVASALPKLLLDLITRVDGNKESGTGADDGVVSYKNATVFRRLTEDDGKPRSPIDPTVKEIASKLPKVWKVLTELLSHHVAPEDTTQTEGDERQCYKNIETPQGTRSVISVSKTFIRLKNLILEKKALQRELSRLKHLNAHLEQRLDDQEKRLSQVHAELHKTWGVVGRMRSQHQQLHTHEKVLRYELQEKRIMLAELKQELEYCRDKWERARQKNDESETEWRKLRKEFANRKMSCYGDTINDSGESGFSDEHDGESDGEHSRTPSPVAVSRPTNDEPSCSSEIQTGDDEARRARLERLQRLEEQCELLVRKVDITAHKSQYLSDRLEELHEYFGEPDKIPDPPPMPELNINPQQFASFYTEFYLKKSSLKTVSTPTPPPPPPLPPLPSLSSSSSSSLSPSSSSSLSSSSSSSTYQMPSPESFDERIAAREARMARLEEQCMSLVGKVSTTMEAGNLLNNRLQELHDECINRESNVRATEDNVESSSKKSDDEDED